jgi:hypothetical protein
MPPAFQGSQHFGRVAVQVCMLHSLGRAADVQQPRLLQVLRSWLHALRLPSLCLGIRRWAYVPSTIQATSLRGLDGTVEQELWQQWFHLF